MDFTIFRLPKIIKYIIYRPLFKKKRILLGYCGWSGDGYNFIYRHGNRMEKVRHLSLLSFLFFSKPTANDLLELDGIETSYYNNNDLGIPTTYIIPANSNIKII